MYIHVHESMYKYKHVCTMFSSLHTDLPYPVQVVRIPDDILHDHGAWYIHNVYAWYILGPGISVVYHLTDIHGIS